MALHKYHDFVLCIKLISSFTVCKIRNDFCALFLLLSSDKLCLVVVPALLGLSRALQGTATSRREAFWHLFESRDHTSGGGGKWRQKQKEGEGKKLEEWSFGDKELKTLSGLVNT